MSWVTGCVIWNKNLNTGVLLLQDFTVSPKRAELGAESWLRPGCIVILWTSSQSLLKGHAVDIPGAHGWASWMHAWRIMVTTNLWIYVHKARPPEAVHFLVSPFARGEEWRQLSSTVRFLLPCVCNLNAAVQPKCPFTDEWIKKMWHIYTMEYYSAIKRNKTVICSEADGPRVCHTEWSKSEREKQIPYANTYIWNLKKKFPDEPRGRTGIKTQT